MVRFGRLRCYVDFLTPVGRENMVSHGTVKLGSPNRFAQTTSLDDDVLNNTLCLWLNLFFLLQLSFNR